MKTVLLATICIAFVLSRTSAFTVSSRGNGMSSSRPRLPAATISPHHHHHRSTSTALNLDVDQNVLMGAGIAFAGLAAGIGLVAFTEAQGERARQRGGGLSDSMSTQLAGKLMEDVEVSSVSDLGSLTSQLEAALKESGGAGENELEMSEEDKKRLAEEADDGW